MKRNGRGFSINSHYRSCLEGVFCRLYWHELTLIEATRGVRLCLSNFDKSKLAQVYTNIFLSLCFGSCIRTVWNATFVLFGRTVQAPHMFTHGAVILYATQSERAG